MPWPSPSPCAGDRPPQAASNGVRPAALDDAALSARPELTRSCPAMRGMWHGSSGRMTHRRRKHGRRVAVRIDMLVREDDAIERRATEVHVPSPGTASPCARRSDGTPSTTRTAVFAAPSATCYARRWITTRRRSRRCAESGRRRAQGRRYPRAAPQCVRDRGAATVGAARSAARAVFAPLSACVDRSVGVGVRFGRRREVISAMAMSSHDSMSCLGRD